jgi:hypothetical protein
MWCTQTRQWRSTSITLTEYVTVCCWYGTQYITSKLVTTITYFCMHYSTFSLVVTARLYDVCNTYVQSIRSMLDHYTVIARLSLLPSTQTCVSVREY